MVGCSRLPALSYELGMRSPRKCLPVAASRRSAMPGFVMLLLVLLLSAAHVLGRIRHRGRIAGRKRIVQCVVQLLLFRLGTILLGVFRPVFERAAHGPVPSSFAA